MGKIDKYIEIVSSSRTYLSSMNKESRDSALIVLSERYATVGVTIVNSRADLDALVAKKPDLVFLGVKFVPSDSAYDSLDNSLIWVADYLDKHGIAYTGSNQLAHKLELCKPLAKQCANDAGLKTSPYYVAIQHRTHALEALNLVFPMFVKPTSRGGGTGIDSDSLVHNYTELRAKIQAIASRLKSDSLVEEYLPGREFSVAILKKGAEAGYYTLPIELVAQLDECGARMLSKQVKSSNNEQVLEVNDMDLRSKVNTLALDIFHVLGARDYGRIDIRLDAFGVPHFLEANLLPSLIEGYGSFPKACMLNAGLSYKSVILHIAELGFLHTSSNINSYLAPNALMDKVSITPKAAFEPVL